MTMEVPYEKQGVPAWGSSAAKRSPHNMWPGNMAALHKRRTKGCGRSRHGKYGSIVYKKDKGLWGD